MFEGSIGGKEHCLGGESMRELRSLMLAGKRDVDWSLVCEGRGAERGRWFGTVDGEGEVLALSMLLTALYPSPIHRTPTSPLQSSLPNSTLRADGPWAANREETLRTVYGRTLCERGLSGRMCD